MATGVLKLKYYTIPINIDVHIPYDKKKPNLIKVWLFNIKWNWKNRKWKNCRAKIRAYERDFEKELLKG